VCMNMNVCDACSVSILAEAIPFDKIGIMKSCYQLGVTNQCLPSLKVGVELGRAVREMRSHAKRLQVGAPVVAVNQTFRSDLLLTARGSST
jgi:hypothetical protein